MNPYYFLFGYEFTVGHVAVAFLCFIIFMIFLSAFSFPSAEERRKKRIAKLQGRADELEVKHRIASLEEELRQEKRKSTALTKRDD